MQLQRAFEIVRRFAIAFVFWIARNGVAELGHVVAQLVGAPGDGAQRYPGCAIGGGGEHAVLGDGVDRAQRTKSSAIGNLVLQ